MTNNPDPVKQTDKTKRKTKNKKTWQFDLKGRQTSFGGQE